MTLNTADSLEGPGRRPGWPIGWVVVSWVVVALAAYWIASARNPGEAPVPVAATADKGSVTAAPPAPVAATAAPAPAAASPAPTPPALATAAVTARATPPAATPATPPAAQSPAAAPATVPTEAPASATIVKCVINGVVTFSDEPCAAVAGGRPKTGGQQMAAAPARIERKTTCEGHEDAIRQIDLQAGTTLNTAELEGLALRRKQHRDAQFRMRC